ncbi:MAG: DUF4474 domain-containing protein [Clostridia bacterium]|nr:DUF4474 domain-containing protein [Clostridia bacterium]
MKKIISVLLAFTMIFSFAGISAHADEPVQEEKPNNGFLGNITKALSFFKYGINDTHVYLVPCDGENKYEFHLSYSESDGTEKDIGLGAYYDETTGEVSGAHYSQGIFESGFNYNAHTEIFYAMNDCWQRGLGFTPLYDLLANMTAFDYVTRRVYFDYGGEEWCIQLWKGNYGFDLLVGGEVGVYNREEGSLGFFYNCAEDEDMMPISIKVYNDERVFVDREAYLTWWATGFAFSDPVNERKLTLETSITFPDSEMRDAFVASAEKQLGVTCTVTENTVLVKW